MRLFKILSLMLHYPDATLHAHGPEIAQLLREDRSLSADIIAPLAALAEEISRADLLDMQERYVELFDQTRSLSLYLFEHLHGESRDRGQAMVDLRHLYEAHGFDIAPGELPDYLPLFLEFLAQLPAEESLPLLGEIRPVAATLEARLTKRKTPYSAVLRAVLALAPEAPALTSAATPETEPPAACDASWAEAPVTFTGSQALAATDIGGIAR